MVIIFQLEIEVVTKIDFKKSCSYTPTEPKQKLHVCHRFLDCDKDEQTVSRSVFEESGWDTFSNLICRNSRTASSFCCVPECTYVAVYVCMCV